MPNDNKLTVVYEEAKACEILGMPDFNKIFNASKFKIVTEIKESIESYPHEKRLTDKISKILARKRIEIVNNGLKATLERHDIEKQNFSSIKNRDDLLYSDADTHEKPFVLNASNTKHMIAQLHAKVTEFNTDRYRVLDKADDFLRLDKLAVIAMISSMATSIIPFARHYLAADSKDLEYPETGTRTFVQRTSHFDCLFIGLMESTTELMQSVLSTYSKEIFFSQSKAHIEMAHIEARALFQSILSLLKANYIGRYANKIPISGNVYKILGKDEFQYAFNLYSLTIQKEAFAYMYWIYRAMDDAIGDDNCTLSKPWKEKVVFLALNVQSQMEHGKTRKWSKAIDTKVFFNKPQSKLKDYLLCTSPITLTKKFDHLPALYWDNLVEISQLLDSTRTALKKDGEIIPREIIKTKKIKFRLDALRNRPFLCFDYERVQLKCDLTLASLVQERERQTRETQTKYKALRARQKKQLLIAKIDTDEKNRIDKINELATKTQAKNREQHEQDVQNYEHKLQELNKIEETKQVDRKRYIDKSTQQTVYLDRLQSDQDAQRNFQVLQQHLRTQQTLSNPVDNEKRMQLIKYWRSRDHHSEILRITQFCMKFQLDDITKHLPRLIKSHDVNRNTVTEETYHKVLKAIDSIKDTLFLYLEPIKQKIFSRKQRTAAELKMYGSISGKYYALLAETRVVYVNLYLTSYKTAPEFQMAINSINKAIKRMNDAIYYLDRAEDTEIVDHLKISLKIYDDMLRELKSRQKNWKSAVERAQIELAEIQYRMEIRRQKGFKQPFNALSEEQRERIRRNKLDRDELSNFIESTNEALVSDSEFKLTSQRLKMANQYYREKFIDSLERKPSQHQVFERIDEKNLSSHGNDVKVIDMQKDTQNKTSTSHPFTVNHVDQKKYYAANSLDANHSSGARRLDLKRADSKPLESKGSDVKHSGRSHVGIHIKQEKPIINSSLQIRSNIGISINRPENQIPKTRKINIANSILPNTWTKERRILIEKYISLACNKSDSKNVEVLFQQTIKPLIIDTMKTMFPNQPFSANQISLIYFGSAVRRLVLSEQLDDSLEWDRDHDHLILLPFLEKLYPFQQKKIFDAVNKKLPKSYRNKYIFKERYGGLWHKVRETVTLKDAAGKLIKTQSVLRDITLKDTQGVSIIAPSVHLVIKADQICLKSTVANELNKQALQNRQLMITSEFNIRKFVHVAYLLKSCIFFLRDGYTFSNHIHKILKDLMNGYLPGISLENVWQYCVSHYDINENDIISPLPKEWGDTDSALYKEEAKLIRLKHIIAQFTDKTACSYEKIPLSKKTACSDEKILGSERQTRKMAMKNT